MTDKEATAAIEDRTRVAAGTRRRSPPSTPKTPSSCAPVTPPPPGDHREARRVLKNFRAELSHEVDESESWATGDTCGGRFLLLAPS
jgi:hypothetical protein